MRAALVQLRSSDDPAANLPVTEGLIREAASAGAELILTPECTNIVSASRTRQKAVLAPEKDDATLRRLQGVSAELAVWLVIGSLLLRSSDADERFVNRCFVLGPDGSIRARYDKIHMFDVDLPDGESYRESAAFRPGAVAVTAGASAARLGLSICYDLRFPALYRDLARAGAQVLTIPSAFTVPTGKAHWHALLRARAIETGCFVLAPAQSGQHDTTDGRSRRTYGHSLAVNPWGEVIAEANEAIGVTPVELDLAEVAEARRRIPSLGYGRDYSTP
jgi:predicted amidohydrolase